MEVIPRHWHSRGAQILPLDAVEVRFAAWWAGLAVLGAAGM
jgi:hypothetical protein